MANTTNSAFLTNGVGTNGTQLDDGLRVGPINDRKTTNGIGQITSANPYDQWGRGMLLSAANTYNMIPRGASARGNVVGLTVGVAPAGAGYLTLTPDGYITASGVSPTGGTISGGSQTYLQLDWPRALSVVTNATTGGAGTITVFGNDFYGAQMQESVTIAAGSATYQMKKAFYQIDNAYFNGTAVTAGNIQIQTTDTYGLPYAVSSFGDVQAISWGNQSEMMGSLASISTVAGSSVTAGETLNGTTQVLIPNAGVVSGQANIQLTYRAPIAATGFLSVPTTVAGTNFSIQSSNATDVSTAFYSIMPNNWPQGRASLVAGTVFVSCPQVNANSVIQLTYRVTGPSLGILSAPPASIIPGVGFTINSSNNLDASSVFWCVTQQSRTITQGVAQLVNGTVTVNTSSATALYGQIILLSYANSSIGTVGANANLHISAATAGTSFTILSANLNTQNATDQSTVYWTIIPLSNQYVNGISTTFTTLAPLGTFTPADSRTATNTTGDVRGTYLPSTPADGGKELHFTYFVHGYDNFQNQQALNSLPAGGTSSSNLVTRNRIGISDQVGVQQYYTGIHA